MWENVAKLPKRTNDIQKLFDDFAAFWKNFIALPKYEYKFHQFYGLVDLKNEPKRHVPVQS